MRIEAAPAVAWHFDFYSALIGIGVNTVISIIIQLIVRKL